MSKSPISDISPFKMYGNLYFVGSTKVSVHLIDTEAGLVLIDAGYPDMYEQITDSICHLGFDPRNICAIIHSHGHIDHFGCTPRFKELSDAKTYISRIDNDIANGTLDLSWANELDMEHVEFENDILIDDGDVLDFGSTSIRCRLTPGHTDGTLSFFINISDGSHSIIVAMHGGIGTNSMTSDYLNTYGLPFTCRDKFREGLRSLAEEKVDLVLGNHPQQNDTEGKLRRILAGQSIIDADEWKKFLLTAEEKLDILIKKETENNSQITM